MHPRGRRADGPQNKTGQVDRAAAAGDDICTALVDIHRVGRLRMARREQQNHDQYSEYFQGPSDVVERDCCKLGKTGKAPAEFSVGYGYGYGSRKVTIGIEPASLWSQPAPE